MSFPYQCLATAILTSCPAGLTGICRLTPLPSPYTPNTHAQTATLASSNTSTSRYRYKSFSHSITRGHVHHPRKGNCFLSIAHRLYTSCLSFPSNFSSRAPGSFHRKAICEAFSHSVLVCLSWMGA